MAEANAPAYPVSRSHPDQPELIIADSGLTKREYFAVLLMAAICQNPNHVGGYLGAAKEAVKHADALISELSQTKPQ